MSCCGNVVVKSPSWGVTAAGKSWTITPLRNLNGRWPQCDGSEHGIDDSKGQTRTRSSTLAPCAEAAVSSENYLSGRMVLQNLLGPVFLYVCTRVGENCCFIHILLLGYKSHVVSLLLDYITKIVSFYFQKTIRNNAVLPVSPSVQIDYWFLSWDLVGLLHSKGLVLHQISF